MTFHGPERFRHSHAVHIHGDATVEHEEELEEPPSAGGSHATAHAAAHGGAHDAGQAGSHYEHHGGPPHESPAVVTVPLIALAIPSVIIGFLTVAPVLFGNYFGEAIQALEHNNVVGEIGHEFPGPVAFALHGFVSLPFLLLLAGAFCAWLFFLKKP